MKTGKIKTIDQLKEIKERYHSELEKFKYRIFVCSGAGCVSSNCGLVRDAVLSELMNFGMQNQVKVFETGCMGTCAVGPVMLVMPDKVFYTELDEEKARRIVRTHIKKGQTVVLTIHLENMFRISRTSISLKSK